MPYHAGMADPRITIFVDGELALTPEQAGDLLGLKAPAVRTAISRLGLDDAGKVSGRPVYLASRLLPAIKGRPGRGANLRKIKP